MSNENCYQLMLTAAPKAEQPPEQEPVAWMLADAVGGSMMEFQRELLLEFQCRYGGEIVPLYTAPQPVSDDARDALVKSLERLQNAACNIGGEHVNELQPLLDAADDAGEALAAYRAAMGSDGDD